MVLPALLAWQLFNVLQRLPWLHRPWFRSGLVAVSSITWMLTLAYGLVLLIADTPLVQTLKWVHEALPSFGANIDSLPASPSEWAHFLTFHPLTLTAVLVLALLAAWLERRLENAPEFPIGLLVGQVAVLTTAFLNCLVLAWGGQENWQTLAQLVFLAHLPLAVIEGLVSGFTIGFLVRVKPEMLGWVLPEETECSVDPLS
jgi:ABC-type Co2+ transport system permease subunit